MAWSRRAASRSATYLWSCALLERTLTKRRASWPRRAILVNIFGGIARGDEIAHGLVEARRAQDRHVPMVVRIVGTNADEAARILAAAGDPDVQTVFSFDEAVERAVAAAKEASVPAGTIA